MVHFDSPVPSTVYNYDKESVVIKLAVLCGRAVSFLRQSRRKNIFSAGKMVPMYESHLCIKLFASSVLPLYLTNLL